MELFKKGLGYNQISNVFQVFETYTEKKSPTKDTVRQWTLRNGHAKLHAPLPTGVRWAMLGDLTIDIGTVKCLVTVGADLDKLEERGDYTLSLKDLHILGIHPTKRSSGEFAKKAFDEACEKISAAGMLEVLCIDGGSDVQKAGRLLQKANKNVKILYDLSHKLALVLEKELKSDPKWEGYTKQLTQTRQLLQQTEFAALMPPKQRSKARFMNAALYIDWPDKIRISKESGYLDEIPEVRYEKYFGWLSEYFPSLDKWIPMVGIIELIKHDVRIYGLSEECYDYLIETVEGMSLGKETEEFIGTVFQSLQEEADKLDIGQTLPAFTEAEESLFGSVKNHTAKGGQGLCGNILIIPNLVGESQTLEQIKEAMESTPVKKVITWIHGKIGETVGSMRRRFTSGKKLKNQGTRFDSHPSMAASG